jgi:hypothetical protein
MRDDVRDQRTMADERHRELVEEMRAMQSAQQESTRDTATTQAQVAELAGWQKKHEQHHGLVVEVKPSVWVANSAAWAYHHPGRLLAASLGIVALGCPPVRTWIVGHATWFIRLWLVGA